jgi:hypothetical protein
MDRMSAGQNRQSGAFHFWRKRIALAGGTSPYRRVWSVLSAGLLTAWALPLTVAAPIQNPANGHFYEAVAVSQGITWNAANRAAPRRMHADLPGHVATITSIEENLFVTNHFRRATQNGYWLGGFQLRGILDPAAGWQWVTGEPFSYTNWLDIDFSMPDDAYGPGTTSDDENALHFWPGAGGRWNDAPPSASNFAGGYLVEYEAALSPGDPVITAYAPADRTAEALNSAPPATLVRLTGSNFGQSGTVVFEGIPLPAAVATWSPTEVLLFVPTAPSYPFKARAVVVVSGKRAEGGEFTITAPAPEKDNLLANGSFEFPNSSDSPVDWGYTYGLPLDPDPTFYKGASIPGWRIPRGTIDVKDIYWRHAPDQGRQSIDLVGSPGAALIEQSLFTEPGRSYILSGWIAHNYLAQFGRATVYINGEVARQLSHTTASTSTRMNWTRFTYQFSAEEEQTTLSILDMTRYSLVHGLALDGLSVTLASN